MKGERLGRCRHTASSTTSASSSLFKYLISVQSSKGVPHDPLLFFVSIAPCLRRPFAAAAPGGRGRASSPLAGGSGVLSFECSTMGRGSEWSEYIVRVVRGTLASDEALSFCHLLFITFSCFAIMRRCVRSCYNSQ